MKMRSCQFLRLLRLGFGQGSLGISVWTGGVTMTRPTTPDPMSQGAWTLENSVHEFTKASALSARRDALILVREGLRYRTCYMKGLANRATEEDLVTGRSIWL